MSIDEYGFLLDFMVWLFDSDEHRDAHHKLIREFIAERDA